MQQRDPAVSSFFDCFLLRPGCRDVPAQGLTPPLHPRKGFHPLTHFRWRDYVELREGAVSIAGCGAACSETLASYVPFFLSLVLRLGCRDIPAQGFHPCT